MKPETFDIIRQTLPVLEQYGEKLADCFYKNMFRHNPEIKTFFNPAHQNEGTQQRALAAALCGYAQHADNPQKLQHAIELIAHKHVALGIKPEHYPIVGNNLLLTLREVLGEAATDDIIDAWADAYGVLAGLFIDREDDLYHQQKVQHGWQGFKAFTLIRRHQECSNITSFYLRPTDSLPLQAYLPGQYITLKIQLADASQAMRNYSLSAAPREDYFRISVKKEKTRLPEHDDGVVSNRLHDSFNEGDQLLVGPPCGVFTLKLPVATDRRIVFIAGGIGITPLLAMLHHGLAHSPKRPFTLIQLARDNAVLPFYEELSVLARTYENFDWHIRLSQPAPILGTEKLHHSVGRLDTTLLEQLLPDPQADYYLCGPSEMIKATLSLLQQRGVDRSAIFTEFFGPSQPL
ncbi:NO-inducible flavohemoprotein [Methylophaga sp.]|uniref:NO-inducible flavohemoprotein n=1 Tax=Methylophaga sp. TaxID=2024840 RepID=UPI00271D6AF5|nr:NO-inducible flavohemoprotein [Methylophaga sp.]MDO8825128.1 NO-inducible flavohemoprotein [Methylophaga sp.]